MFKTRWMMLAATIALLSATPLAAETQPYGLDSSPSTTAPVAPAAVATASDADQVVCKSLGPPPGSRFGDRHICQTAREWDAQRKRHQQDVQHEQTRAGQYGMQ